MEQVTYITYNVIVRKNDSFLGENKFTDLEDVKIFVNYLKCNKQIVCKVFRVTNWRPVHDEINLDDF